MSSFEPKSFTVVIPALDEEEAIGATIERCLAARDTISAAVPGLVTKVVVVSDGSRDNTAAIAEGFDEVDLLVFEKNRGYGAAIKTGFQHGNTDLVGFLDADGTCDPEFFAVLCKEIVEGADLALGSRMGEGSQMPAIRRLGNKIFATILSLLSGRTVGDSASGMRVLRNTVLQRLEPLPDGLHYTPAMSARALLRDDINIVEVPMSYSERVGESKLSVGKDGLRFLSVILATAMALRPARLLLAAAFLALSASLLVASYPVLFYVENSALEEWMIYRLLLASLLAGLGAQLVFAAALGEKVAALADRREAARSGIVGLLRPLYSPKFSWAVGGLLLAAAIVLVFPGIEQFVTTGTVTLHWSRAVLAALLVSSSSGLFVSSLLFVVVDLLVGSSRVGTLLPPDRVRLGTAVAPEAQS